MMNLSVGSPCGSGSPGSTLGSKRGPLCEVKGKNKGPAPLLIYLDGQDRCENSSLIDDVHIVEFPPRSAKDAEHKSYMNQKKNIVHNTQANEPKTNPCHQTGIALIVRTTIPRRTLPICAKCAILIEYACFYLYRGLSKARHTQDRQNRTCLTESSTTELHTRKIGLAEQPNIN